MPRLVVTSRSGAFLIYAHRSFHQLLGLAKVRWGGGIIQTSLDSCGGHTRPKMEVFTKAVSDRCHIPLLYKKNTNMNAHETPILRTFKLCTLQKLYNLNTIL